MNKKIMLSLLRKDVEAQIDYVQGATSPDLQFYVSDMKIPDGAMANLYVKKPSGEATYTAGRIEGNSIMVSPTNQLFAESGRHSGQLQLLLGDKQLVSFLLCFRVEKNLIDGEAIESTSEFSALQDALKDVGDTKQGLQEAKTDISNLFDTTRSLDERIFQNRTDLDNLITTETLEAFKSLGWTPPESGGY